MTPVEAKALAFVVEFIDMRGYAPTITEIGKHLDFSTPRAWHIVQSLVGQHQLVKNGGGHRSLELPGVPDLRAVPTSRLQAELGRRGANLQALAVTERRTLGGREVTCAVDFCNVVVPRGHLMCRRHWLAVPRHLQSSIFAAFTAKDAERYGDLVFQAREIAASATAVAA